MTATAPLRVPVGAGTRLLGEVIAWACPGLSVPHTDLVRALDAAGLDPGVARELAPRPAFSRACRRLSDQRIIRPVSEDAATVKFQFTQESREGDRFAYVLETMLTLDKQTGSVTCERPGLATLAQDGTAHLWDATTGAHLFALQPRAAVLDSVVGTCRRLGLDPFAYLADAIGCIPGPAEAGRRVPPRLVGCGEAREDVLTRRLAAGRPGARPVGSTAAR